MAAQDSSTHSSSDENRSSSQKPRQQIVNQVSSAPLSEEFKLDSSLIGNGT